MYQQTVGAGIVCPRPQGLGTVTNGGTITTTSWVDPPNVGDWCSEVQRVPVTLTNLDNPYNHYWRATVRGPDGVPYETVTADFDIGQDSPIQLSEVGPTLGTHFVTVWYNQVGTWDLRSPGDPQSGYCNGPWTVECQRVFRPEGLGTVFRDPCAHILQVQPNPPSCVVQCLPSAQIYADLNQIIATTRAGAIRTAPGTDRGLVNLPDCSWIENADGASQRQFVFSVVGPPDASGRAFRYEYVVTVGLLSVGWNYDDPQQPGFQPGDIGSPWTQGGLCTNPHTYRRISDWNPSQRAHITAKETYGAWVNVVWYDGGSSHQYEIGELDQTFTIWAVPEDQFVGQVEAIPTS